MTEVVGIWVMDCTVYWVQRNGDRAEGVRQECGFIASKFDKETNVGGINIDNSRNCP